MSFDIRSVQIHKAILNWLMGCFEQSLIAVSTLCLGPNWTSNSEGFECEIYYLNNDTCGMESKVFERCLVVSVNSDFD